MELESAVPCRTVTACIWQDDARAYEIQVDVHDWQVLPGPDHSLPEYITVLLCRYFYRSGACTPSALIVGCRVWLVGGSLRASIYTDEECRTLTGEDAHRALRHALCDAAGLLREMALGRIA